MGLFSPNLPSYPDRPTFNLPRYREALQTKLRGDITQAEAPRSGLEGKLLELALRAKKTQEADIARRGLLTSGIRHRRGLTRANRISRGFGQIETGIEKNKQGARKRINDTELAAVELNQNLTNTYNLQRALVERARKDIKASSRRGALIGGLGLLGSVIAAPATGGLSLALGVPKAIRAANVRGISGTPPGLVLPPKYQGRPKYANETEKNLDPFTRQYWGQEYYNKYLAPQRGGY